MARNTVTLYTRDTLVTTTSKGNQEKWYDKATDAWYKLDCHGFESLAEAVASGLLQNFSNVPALGYEVAHYTVEKATVHGYERVVSVSKNFRRPEESLVSAYRLLTSAYGQDFGREFKKRKNLQQRMAFLVETVEEITGLQDFGKYLTLLFEIDALILNQDRHLNNIAVMRTAEEYRFCPIFDNGAAFLLDYGLYPYEIETKALLPQARALPFNTTYTANLRAARKLYGPQLRVDFCKEDIKNILAPLLEFYPQGLRYALAQRIEDVLLLRKKGFE